jgi:uncharacterized protein (DUF983 family)
MAGGAPSAAVAGALGRCPRCGKGRLFAGYLRIAPRCEYCGLNFAMFDVGDGALIVEMAYSPPYWVHAALWLPAIAILTLGGLRLVKSALIVLQYKHQAREGRLAK